MVARGVRTFGPIELDTRLWPLVHMDFRERKVERDADFHAALKYIEELLESGEKSFQVTNLPVATIASAAQRHLLGDWTKRTSDLQRKNSLGGALVAPDTIVRSVIAAIHWMWKPPAPTSVVATLTEARLVGISSVERAQLMTPELRELKVTCQAELRGFGRKYQSLLELSERPESKPPPMV